MLVYSPAARTWMEWTPKLHRSIVCRDGMGWVGHRHLHAIFARSHKPCVRNTLTRSPTVVIGCLLQQASKQASKCDTEDAFRAGQICLVKFCMPVVQYYYCRSDNYLSTSVPTLLWNVTPDAGMWVRRSRAMFL